MKKSLMKFKINLILCIILIFITASFVFAQNMQSDAVPFEYVTPIEPKLMHPLNASSPILDTVVGRMLNGSSTLVPEDTNCTCSGLNTPLASVNALYVVSFIKDLLQRGIKIINSTGNNVSSLDNSSIKAKDGKPTTLTQEEFNILMSDNPTKSKPNSNVRDA